MFSGFASVWTPVARSSDLKQRPIRVLVAGEPIALFRDAKDHVGAVIDRCPHRGASLSAGRVTPEGCLECPYHGWTFDRTGACTTVPFNPAAPLVGRRLAAQAVPVREAGGLLWVYTEPGAESPREPVLPEECLDPRLVVRINAFRWPIHWTRAMENLLDPAHLPFVHMRSFSGPLRRSMTPETQMRITMESTEHGWQTHWTIDDKPSEAWLEFVRPNRMALHFSARREGLLAWALPACPGETLLFVGMVLPRSRAWMGWLTDRMNARVVREDERVLATCGPGEVPLPTDEACVPSDRSTLAFRRYYYEVLRPSRVASASGRGSESLKGPQPDEAP